MKTTWALIATKDIYEYKEGDVVDVSMWKKRLLNRRTKWTKLVECGISVKS